MIGSRHLSYFNKNGTLKHCLLAVLIISIWNGPVQCSSQAPDLEAAVRQRVEGFWNAMQRADYETAAGFVHPDSRPDFIYRQKKSPVISFKIQSLRFNDDRTICNTTVVVSRPFPYMTVRDPIEWPTENQWLVMPDTQWYLKLPTQEGGNPFLETFKRASESGNTLVAVVPAGTTGNAGGKPEALPPPAKPRQLLSDPSNPVVLHRGEKGIFRYRYENGGAAPIKVVSAKTDCNFITFNGINADIAPGQAGTLEVAVDTYGLPDGPIQKTLNVQFSDLADPMMVVLRTETVPNFVLIPAAVDFGVMSLGKAVDRMVRIVNQSGRKVKLLSAQKSDPQISVILDKMEMGPGEALLVTIRCHPTSEGQIMDSPMLRTDLPSEPLIHIQIRGRIDR